MLLGWETLLGRTSWSFTFTRRRRHHFVLNQDGGGRPAWQRPA
jgi:hypothetical protein